MGKLTRKNLVVDAEKLRELARRYGTSESAAVRRVVDLALAAEEVGDALWNLHARGGIDDVCGRLPDEAAEGKEPDFDRFAEEVGAALSELSARGGVDDVFGRLSDEPGD